MLVNRSSLLHCLFTSSYLIATPLKAYSWHSGHTRLLTPSTMQLSTCVLARETRCFIATNSLAVTSSNCGSGLSEEVPISFGMEADLLEWQRSAANMHSASRFSFAWPIVSPIVITHTSTLKRRQRHPIGITNSAKTSLRSLRPQFPIPMTSVPAPPAQLRQVEGTLHVPALLRGPRWVNVHHSRFVHSRSGYVEAAVALSAKVMRAATHNQTIVSSSELSTRETDGAKKSSPNRVVQALVASSSLRECHSDALLLMLEHLTTVYLSYPCHSTESTAATATLEAFSTLLASRAVELSSKHLSFMATHLLARVALPVLTQQRLLDTFIQACYANRQSLRRGQAAQCLHTLLSTPGYLVKDTGSSEPVEKDKSSDLQSIQAQLRSSVLNHCLSRCLQSPRPSNNTNKSKSKTAEGSDDVSGRPHREDTVRYVVSPLVAQALVQEWVHLHLAVRQAAVRWLAKQYHRSSVLGSSSRAEGFSEYLSVDEGGAAPAPPIREAMVTLDKVVRETHDFAVPQWDIVLLCHISRSSANAASSVVSTSDAVISEAASSSAGGSGIVQQLTAVLQALPSTSGAAYRTTLADCIRIVHRLSTMQDALSVAPLVATAAPTVCTSLLTRLLQLLPHEMWAMVATDSKMTLREVLAGMLCLLAHADVLKALDALVISCLSQVDGMLGSCGRSGHTVKEQESVRLLAHSLCRVVCRHVPSVLVPVFFDRLTTERELAGLCFGPTSRHLLDLLVYRGKVSERSFQLHAAVNSLDALEAGKYELPEYTTQRANGALLASNSCAGTPNSSSMWAPLLALCSLTATAEDELRAFKQLATLQGVVLKVQPGVLRLVSLSESVTSDQWSTPFLSEDSWHPSNEKYVDALRERCSFQVLLDLASEAMHPRQMSYFLYVSLGEEAGPVEFYLRGTAPWSMVPPAMHGDVPVVTAEEAKAALRWLTAYDRRASLEESGILGLRLWTRKAHIACLADILEDAAAAPQGDGGGSSCAVNLVFQYQQWLRLSASIAHEECNASQVAPRTLSHCVHERVFTLLLRPQRGRQSFTDDQSMAAACSDVLALLDMIFSIHPPIALSHWVYTAALKLFIVRRLPVPPRLRQCLSESSHSVTMSMRLT